MKKSFWYLLLAFVAIGATTLHADSNASGGNILNFEDVDLGAGPFDHGGAVGNAFNSTTTATFTGGFTANGVGFTGTSTSVAAGNWGADMSIVVTSPGLFGTPFQWDSGMVSGTYSTIDFSTGRDMSGDFPTGIDPNGQWSLEFIDTFDDDAAGVDSQTSNLVMTFFEFVPLSDSDGNWSLGSLDFGDTAETVGEFALSGLFDSYTFSLANDGFLTAFTSADEDGFTGFDVDTEIAIFNAAGDLLINDDDGGDGTFSGLFDLELAAGDYTVVVAGFNSTFADGFGVTPGNDTGDYRLNLAFAVPEPSTFGLLMCLGAGVGFRRRKS